ncbi:MAG: PilW family protein [Gammaproteobacteria bacterium]
MVIDVNNSTPNSPQQAGFTLVEIMTALVIGAILMLGAITIMVNSKDAYETQDDLARLQENARFAMNLLIKDIRMAGYFGCNTDSDNVYDHVDNGAAGNLFDSSFGLEGLNDYTDGTSTWMPSGATTGAVENTINYSVGNDAITVRYLDPATGVTIDEAMPQPSAVLKVDSVGNLVDGQIIAVSDCTSTDIMQLTQVMTGSQSLQHNTGSGVPGNESSQVKFNFPGCNAPNCLSKAYDEGARVMSIKAVRYYVEDGALHRLMVSPTADASDADSEIASQELVDGVDSLQITYGRDTTGNGVADTYDTADNIAQALWANVSTVRLAMLFNTVDGYGQQLDTKTYDVNGVNFDPADDNRRRRLFTTTVLLRNPQ